MTTIATGTILATGANFPPNKKRRMTEDLTFTELGSDIYEDWEGCAEPVCVSHGDIYRAGAPLATYLARWFEGDRQRGLDLQITLGEWGAGTTWQNRHVIAFHVSFPQPAPMFSLVDSDAVWGAELGNQYSAAEAKQFSVSAQAQELAQAILLRDPSLEGFTSRSVDPSSIK